MQSLKAWLVHVVLILEVCAVLLPVGSLEDSPVVPKIFCCHLVLGESTSLVGANTAR
jgi:hypothetical protein